MSGFPSSLQTQASVGFGPNANRSVNVFGGFGPGSSSDFARILQYASGEPANGGFSTANEIPGLMTRAGAVGYVPLLVIGGVALVALFLFLRR